MEGNFWGMLIRSLREERMISQRSLSAETGINRSTLRNIESGEAPGDMETMEVLLNFFGYELEAIQKGTIPENMRVIQELPLSPERRSKLAAARVLSFRL